MPPGCHAPVGPGLAHYPVTMVLFLLGIGARRITVSALINTVERLGDPFRRRVEAGGPDAPLGSRVIDVHPDWDPSTVDTSAPSIARETVVQGRLGDCWFLAAYMALQQNDPDSLAHGITALGTPPGRDGWRVELFPGRAPQSITVRPSDLGTRGSQIDRDRAGPGGAGTRIGVCSIYEQAMISAADGRPSGVWADTPAAGLELLTGRRARGMALQHPSFAAFARALDAGRPVTVMTHPLRPRGQGAGRLVPAHVYHVRGCDRATGEIILANPHGPRGRAPFTVRLRPDAPGFTSSIVMTGIGQVPDGPRASTPGPASSAGGAAARSPGL